MTITIDGNEHKVAPEKLHLTTHDYLPLIEVGEQEYYLAENTEQAGIAARARWKDIKDNDPKEFRFIIGDERLIRWACRESDSFGISSFDDFLDAIERVPEEEFASYDGREVEVSAVDAELVEKLGFTPTVAYRHN